MRISSRSIGFVIILFSLAGCAPIEKRGDVSHFIVPAELTQALQNAPICCASFANFPYVDLVAGRTSNVKVDVTSPAFMFGTGKSYFVAYRLPPLPRSLRVTVKSYFFGHAFYPSVLVLDENFKPTRDTSGAEFQYVKPGFVERGHIGGALVFVPNTNARYFIIRTRQVDMSQKLYESNNGFAYASKTGAVFVPRRDYAHHFGPVGELEVAATELM
jgi:maltose operon protein